MTNDAWVGQTIDDRYVVRRLIGKGGMGVVYEGEQPSLGRKVAIKFLLASDPAWVERFRREARLASQVVHEHIAQVYDFGRTPDGHPYLVMEYVDGTDLAGALRSDIALPVERAVAITRAMLEGLGAIHALGIIHRDVKPSNVLLTTRGDDRDFVKLGDFGLARGADDAKLTKTGNIVGTTPFMAPEIFRGTTIDHRADLYAVGITLFQMLAGKLPFLGATAEIGALHVWSPPPPLHEQRADLPAWLVQIVERALAKAPDDRFASAQAFIAALDARTVKAAAPSAPATVVERPRPRVAGRRWPWVLVALAIVGGAAVGAWLARPEPAVTVTARDAAIARDADAPMLDAAVAAVRVAPLGPVIAAIDAGTVSKHAGSGVARAVRVGCACMTLTGENSPLCAKQGKPLCRCIVKGRPPLCPVRLLSCTDDWEGFRRTYPKQALSSDSDICHGLGTTDLWCPDPQWRSFARPGIHGASCKGFTNNLFNGAVRTPKPENVETQGTWECDSCPDAENQTYSGVEGDPCTGYHWETGAAIEGRLRHCD